EPVCGEQRRHEQRPPTAGDRRFGADVAGGVEEAGADPEAGAGGDEPPSRACEEAGQQTRCDEPRRDRGPGAVTPPVVGVATAAEQRDAEEDETEDGD